MVAMINLLPETYKKEILAGRSNLLLVRYCVLSLAVTVATVGIIAGVWLMIDRVKDISQQTIIDNEKNSFQLSAKQAEVTEFHTNLKTAKSILDKQIDYSSVALRVASTIPSGVVIDQLSLDPSTFDKPTTMVAHARSENTALELKKAFSDSKYYSDVHFNSISRGDDGSGEYPFTVNLGLTIKKSILYE